MCTLSLLSLIDDINRRWGVFIATHPLKHIFLSLFAIFIPSTFLLNLNIELDIRKSFSPPNSRSLHEESVYNEFFNFSAPPKRILVLFTAKDGGSVLRRTHLEQIKEIDTRFMEILRSKDPETGLKACHPLCEMNAPFHLVTNELLKNDPNTSDSTFFLDYPNSLLNGNKLFIGSNFVNVKVHEKLFPQNNSRIESVNLVVLWYFNRADTSRMRRVLENATLNLFESSKSGHLLTDVKFEIFGDDVANNEMVRGAVEATVLMSIGFLLLLAFVFFVIYRKMGDDGTFLDIIIVVSTSVLCPLLASMAAFGLNTWLGNDTYTIMCVAPFLITGVGVDDAFIMLQSFHQHRNIKALDERLSTVMVHAGPSITITSLTNTIAFGIGWLSVTAPQMSLFCFCTSLAVFFDYILTFTLLGPILIILASKRATDIDNLKKSTSIPTTFEHEKLTETPSTEGTTSTTNEQQELPRFFREYSVFLHSVAGRVCAITLTTALLVFAAFGVFTMTTFEPSKAFPSDSPLANSINSISQVFEEFFALQFIVSRPPEISNPNSYSQFYKMINELESLPEIYGPERTLLWLRPYEEFEKSYDHTLRLLGLYSGNFTLNYDNVDFFLEKIGNPPSVKVERKNHDDPTIVKAFQFTIVAKHMTEWWNRAVVEEKCREIIDRYPQFNVSIYDGDSAILGLLLTVKTDLIFSIAITIVCMTIICSFLIPNRLGVCAISLTITSICFALVGFMSWWGADLDPVTMVDVLLATGFSVDYTAHIAHQYHTKSGTSLQRIGHSLHEMCPPMLQAGISTVLCMLPLTFVPTYAIVAFAKTVFIVVSVGLLHGLFLLPVLLCAIPKSLFCCFDYRRSAESSPSSPTKEILIPENKSALDINPLFITGLK